MVLEIFPIKKDSDHEFGIKVTKFFQARGKRDTPHHSAVKGSFEQKHADKVSLVRETIYGAIPRSHKLQ